MVNSHQIAHEVPHVAFFHSNSAEACIQSCRCPSDRLREGVLQLRGELPHQLNRLGMLWDVGGDVATQQIKVPTAPLLSSRFQIRQIFEIRAGSKHMCAVDEAVAVEVIVSSEDNVDNPIRLLRQLIIIRLPLMRKRNHNLRPLLPQLRHQLLRSLGSRLVDEVRRQDVDGGQPLALAKPDQPDLDAVGGGEHVRFLAVADGHALAECWVEDVGHEPGEFAAR